MKRIKEFFKKIIDEVNEDYYPISPFMKIIQLLNLFILIVFIILKVTKAIDWNWGIVLIPLYDFLFLIYIVITINIHKSRQRLHEDYLKGKKLYFVKYEFADDQDTDVFNKSLSNLIYGQEVAVVFVEPGYVLDIYVCGKRNRHCWLDNDSLDYLIDLRKLKEINNEQLDYDSLDIFLREYNVNYLVPDDEQEPAEESIGDEGE